MQFPQLRVRTEFSFRNAYGPVPRIKGVLEDLGTPFAGCVDSHGTWGHVDWHKALKDSSVSAGFGLEHPLLQEDGRKPVAWALSRHLPDFYRFSSAIPDTEEKWAEAKGVVRFAGAALSDPESFDFIDLNPRSVWQTLRSLELHRRTGKPLVLTSDNDYPAPEDVDRFMAWNDSAKMTPQWLLRPQDLGWAFRTLDQKTFDEALDNTQELAKELAGQKLDFAPVIQVDGSMEKLIEEGKAYRLAAGHIKEWTQEYEDRLVREIAMIRQKQYQSYFIVVADLVSWAKERMLVGPARGSSAGSLVCYLMQITEVDPLPHGLLFERFIDINRDDLPDIDIDFSDKKRHLVFDYLAEKYGSENVARIGSINRLKPRSVVAHVTKKLGIPHGVAFPVLNVLIEHSSGSSLYGQALRDTLETTNPGQTFMREYPEAALMTELELHASHTGVHAAGIIVANVPVVEYCTVREGVAQVDKKGAEELNLLKIDALGLRTLGVIEDAGVTTAEELYGLEMDDPKVLAIFDQHKFSGLFQFEGAAQRQVSTQVPMDSFRKIDHVTALARPGPLGGGAANTYINRNLGREPVTFRHPSMEDYLGETQGVVLYQEQVMRIVRELGKFSWEDTSTIRKAMSGRKGKEFFDRHGAEFVKGAAQNGIDEETAQTIWSEICNFGAWGMNKSHTTSYAIISYWCAWMKAYHPIEYAAACLRNAKDEEQTVEVLRELVSEGVPMTPFDIELSGEDWVAADGKLVGGFKNLVGVGPVKARNYVAKRDAGELSEKDRAAIAKCEVKHAELRPAHALWGDYYANPEKYNVHGRITEFAAMEDFEKGVVICRLLKNVRRDENEAVLVNKRGHEFEGQSLFLEMMCVDDSISKPARVRIKTPLWESLGQPIADGAVPGEDWFLVRGMWLKQFSMLIVRKIKCLTNPELI